MIIARVLLKIQMKEDKALHLLDIRIKKMKDGCVVTSLFQNKYVTALTCRKRSDVDGETVIKDMEERIEKIHIEEDIRK